MARNPSAHLSVAGPVRSRRSGSPLPTAARTGSPDETGLSRPTPHAHDRLRNGLSKACGLLRTEGTTRRDGHVAAHAAAARSSQRGGPEGLARIASAAIRTFSSTSAASPAIRRGGAAASLTRSRAGMSSISRSEGTRAARIDGQRQPELVTSASAGRQRGLPGSLSRGRAWD